MPRSGARLPAASLTFGMTCTAIPRHARTRNHKSAPRAKVSLCDSISSNNDHPTALRCREQAPSITSKPDLNSHALRYSALRAAKRL